MLRIADVFLSIVLFEGKEKAARTCGEILSLSAAAESRYTGGLRCVTIFSIARGHAHMQHTVHA